MLPGGDTKTYPFGLEFNNQFVDRLLETRIKPIMYLNQRELLQSKFDAGSWPNRETTDLFAEYTQLMLGRLGGPLDMWMTHKEPRVVAFLGYGSAVMTHGIAHIRLSITCSWRMVKLSVFSGEVAFKQRWYYPG